MERLTIPDEPIEGGMRRAIIDARAVREEAMTIYWRLKRYEDICPDLERLKQVDQAYLDRCQEVTALREQLAGKWIPVEERLPEDGEIVLVTRQCQNKKWYTEQDEYYIETGWESGADENIIAWMPLPEPYRLGD